MAIDVIYEPQVEYSEDNTPDIAHVSARTGKLATGNVVQLGRPIPNLEDWNQGPSVPEMLWPGDATSKWASFEARNRDAVVEEERARYAGGLG